MDILCGWNQCGEKLFIIWKHLMVIECIMNTMEEGMFEFIGIMAVITAAYFFGKNKGKEEARGESKGEWKGWPRV